MAKTVYPTSKKELINAINEACGEKTITFTRKVAIYEKLNGGKNYACAVSRNKFYIHFPSYCTVGGMRHDIGRTYEYSLHKIDTERLTKLYKQVTRDI